MSVKRSRSLRRNQTDAEAKLWRMLRSRRLRNAKFRRQRPIGPYVVDFACLNSRLVIEVDGGQHADDTPNRTVYLEKQGFRVLRFWNNEVLTNIEGVLTVIAEELRNRR